MEVGTKVICVVSFEELRASWGFDYPSIGDILTVSDIEDHPNPEVRALGIVCLYFQEKPMLCGICDKDIHDNPNFIPIDEKQNSLVETIEETIKL